MNFGFKISLIIPKTFQKMKTLNLKKGMTKIRRSSPKVPSYKVKAGYIFETTYMTL